MSNELCHASNMTSIRRHANFAMNFTLRIRSRRVTHSVWIPRVISLSISLFNALPTLPCVSHWAYDQITSRTVCGIPESSLFISQLVAPPTLPCISQWAYDHVMSRTVCAIPESYRTCERVTSHMSRDMYLHHRQRCHAFHIWHTITSFDPYTRVKSNV